MSCVPARTVPSRNSFDDSAEGNIREMLLHFDRTVMALAETTVWRCSLPEAAGRDPAGAVGTFLLDVHARMPDYLRGPFRILTLAFDAWSLPFHGRPFHRLSPDQRFRQVQAWKGSRIEARRRLIEFYETLAVFSLYSDIYGQDYGHGAEHRVADADGSPDGVAHP